MAASSLNEKMRTYHRYLGFFLAGIMAMYAISGVVLIFRDTDFLKSEKQVEKQLKPNLSGEEVGKELRIRDFKVTSETADQLIFERGAYNKQTGNALITVKELPYVMDKMTHLHKANTKQPLFYLNIFFGLSLLFFVVSSFYMFLPHTSVFKKGLYFAGAGLLLTLILLFI
ncbi:MAG: hypothetical protein DI538_03520 [Azospira oryzae]|jgi:hypothetical protein|nr:MAG: hypothetical protein DI538_03520 [Azospira oryzae]